MRYALITFLIASTLLGAVLFWDAFRPRQEFLAGEYAAKAGLLSRQKSVEELIREAQEKSSRVKGLYMTADVANDQGAGGTRLRKKILDLVDSTEINGVVIDVKEVCGPDYSPEYLKKLLDELHQKNIWAIARIVVFKDASQIEARPEWYLTRASPGPVVDECFRKKYLRAKNPLGAVPTGRQAKPNVIFWQDRRGGYWLDPAHPGAREYILGFAKKMIDIGFDELQFDYIRFPSDGDVEKAVYPVWDGKTPKYLVMKDFFEFLHKNLKAYKPDIILSADLFGYAAIRAGDVGIGQRLDDMGDNFDYLSFMVYPSHYYNGLRLPVDPLNGLVAVNFTFSQARQNPGVVVERSLRLARDFLDGKLSTSTSVSLVSASSSLEFAPSPQPRSGAHLRPWLEDFFHEEDKAASRPWGAEKVRMQIEGAEKVEQHGWMLWNAANVYTETALRKD